MSTDIAMRGDTASLAPIVDRGWADGLMAWAAAAQRAHEIAAILCETSFVPKSMQHRPGEVTGAILTGMELGVPIMWALNNIDLIEGSPGIRAKGMRALALRQGHEIWTEETTSTRAIVCGRRKGTTRIERSTWTMDRAKKAGLAGKKTWLAYPNDMLLNRATAEVVRLIAPDVLIGVSHTVDELGGDESPGGLPIIADDQDDPPPVKRRSAQRRAPADAAQVAPPPDMPDPPPAETPARGDPPPDMPPPITRPASEADAIAVMTGAGFEVVDVIDTLDPPGEQGGQPVTWAATCDQRMPHDTRYAAPDGCPPNCPTRQQDDAAAANDLAEQHDGEPPAADPADEPMTMPQRKRLAVEMRKAGLTERGERLAFVVDIIGRHIESSSELTVREASAVIQAFVNLEGVINDGLDRARAAVDEGGIHVGHIE